VGSRKILCIKYTMAFYPAKKSMKKKKGPRRRARVPKASKALTKVINRVINRKAETKQAMFYGNPNTFPQDGSFANRGFSVQNQFITNVAGDMKWLLPNVTVGTGDYQRIGDQITPMSLRINGLLKVSLANLTGPFPTDIIAVCYILTHKTLKSYQALTPCPPVPPATTPVGGADLTTLLKNGENATTGFTGNWWAKSQPIADQYYNVLAKKVVRLRYAGLYTSGGQSVSIANSHDYQADWSVTLTQKHMPAHLKYPEGSFTGVYANSPTNFAPFMCVGYYVADGANSATPAAILESTYVSRLTFKDM